MKRRDFVRHTAAAGTVLTVGPGLTAACDTRSGVRPSVSPDLDAGWSFFRGEAPGAERPRFDDEGWEAADLPHTARIESLVTGPPGSETYQWQGTCWYRKRLQLAPEVAGRSVWLRFEGAMNVADVWLDGEHLGQHMGGWLPFGFDITERVRPGREHVLAVRLDNRDNPVTGPKPLAQLDFNYYHGLYRNVRLVVKDRLHITDPILAERTASGGVFVTYPEASPERARVRVQVHIANRDDESRTFVVRSRLTNHRGEVVAEDASGAMQLAGPDADAEVSRELEVLSPALWSLSEPHLYTLDTEIVEDGKVVDAERTRVGIRRIGMGPEGFRLNGEDTFLRGTNRHQEYPYIGYALSDAAQYRDAKKIKDAGFDYVRLSHYPHAPAFMDACDELGLVVMDCIPGWQYFNREDPRFTEIQYENCRRMLRRDRNHPCVILWEVSLNETDMPGEFIRDTHAIAHEEYPGDQTYTCGWTEGYDVFIQARQHGGCRDVTDRTCVVSEYGDWEYYAQNAGFEQDDWADLAPDEANSRQLRWQGEAALLQQATNFQEAHNDNRKTIAFADGLWVMYDYNRGYAPDIESSGCMDIFRLPKFSRWFFRSQRPADELLEKAESGPMVYIASHWSPGSSRFVRVFSNCEEVELYRDGQLIARRTPDEDRISTHLAHPPFTFDAGEFSPGSLRAVGYLDGLAAANHAVRTAGTPAILELHQDVSGRPFASDAGDVAFLYAAIQDLDGTTVPGAWENVFFGSTGDIELVGRNPFSSEAGVASILATTRTEGPVGLACALALLRDGDRTHVARGVKAFGPAASEVEPEVRVTTDGSDPATGAVHRAGPVFGEGRVRAVMQVEGRTIVEADSEAPKFRIPGSTAPE